MCGEKVLITCVPKYALGSPPRMRGKDNRPRYPGTCPGITPACAGKSRFPSSKAPSRRDHPRVCGEKIVVPSHQHIQLRITPAYAGKRLYLANRKSQVKGSPPRVRGKGHRDSQSDYQRGITPACAGKRLSPHFRVREFQDHPRVCGEKLTSVPVSCFAVGSPPRVRGKAL